MVTFWNTDINSSYISHDIWEMTVDTPINREHKMLKPSMALFPALEVNKTQVPSAS